jgi:hypothetical protein
MVDDAKYLVYHQVPPSQLQLGYGEMLDPLFLCTT